MPLEHLEAVVREPVEGRRRMFDGQPDEAGIRGAAADAHDVVVVRLRGVDDTARLLQLRAGRAHLPGRVEQRTAHLARSLDDEHAGTPLRREDRRRQACIASADDDQVPAATRSGRAQGAPGGDRRRRCTRNLQEFALRELDHDTPLQWIPGGA